MELIQGDCLEVMAGFESESVDMILCDPPYGTTQCKWDSIIPLEPMWEQLKRIIKPNGAIVMTASQPFTTTLISSNMKMFKYCWVWEKQKATGFYNARRMPLKSVEDVCVFGVGKLTYNPQGLTECNIKNSRKNKAGNGVYGNVSAGDYFQKEGNFPRQVLKINHITHKQVHPTQKPVALMEYLIKTYTNEGEAVLDFAMGSGTTGVACKNLGREFIGIELDESYFHIAVDRIGLNTLDKEPAVGMTFEATPELQKKGTWMKESNVHVNATEYPKLTFRVRGNQIDLYADGRLLDGQLLTDNAGAHFSDFEYVFKRAFDMGRASK